MNIMIEGASTTPTVELHRHFEAGLKPETIAELAQRNGVTQALTRNGKAPIAVDPQNPDSIRAYYAKIQQGFQGPSGFLDFMDSLGLPVAVMRTLEDLQFAARHQILDQAQQGSIHTELRGSPYTYQENLKDSNTPLSIIIEAIAQGIKDAHNETDASGAFTACISRNKADQYGSAVVDSVLTTHSADFPIGFDIAGGPEGQYPPALYQNLVLPLREAGVPITIHAGEQSKPPHFTETPPSFIRDAIERLGARRIGHGISLVADEDSQIWDIIRDGEVCIETCPPSNAILGYMPVNQHPLKKYLDAGLSATISTDDPLPFGVTSVREILIRDGEALRLTPEDLIKMTQHGIEAAFVSEVRRSKLRAKFERHIRQK